MIPEHIEALGESYARLWKEFSEFPTREEVSKRIRIFKPKSLANFNNDAYFLIVSRCLKSRGFLWPVL